MGKQSPARDRHRRRDRLDDDAERLGNNLADTEAPYRLDESQRRERNANARGIEAHGPNGICRFADEFLFVFSIAVLHGSGKSLSDVWEVGGNKRF